MTPPLPDATASLGEEIRDLRQLRRLSLAAAAGRAAMTPGALGNWESGRRTPRGAPLARLLDALEPSPRQRARLLALADPAYARIELADDPLGAPVHLGEILRALRRGAGLSQAALGVRVGVRQATVARWESGDDAPDGPSLHAALFAVGAGPEQIAAVTRLPAPQPLSEIEARMRAAVEAPHALSEALLLSLERDLWWRASQDPAVESALAWTISQRAQWCETDGRSDLVAPLAQRARRLASTDRTRTSATPGTLTHAHIRLRQGRNPLAVAHEVEAWAEQGLWHIGIRAWARGTQALALAVAGNHKAVGLARSAVELAGAQDCCEVMFRQIDLAQVYLALGEPERAIEAFGRDFAPLVYGGLSMGLLPWGLATRARAFAAAGESPEPELLPALRGFVARTRIPRYARELRGVERLLARAAR